MQNIDLKNIKKEYFKPWVIRKDNNFLSKVFYFLRLCIDTPHRSLIDGIRPALSQFKGSVLDVGAGSMFYRQLLSNDVRYRALELQPQDGSDFGWEDLDIDLYDGKIMPYENESFDHVMCFEVLEHTEDPQLLLSEIARVLKRDGVAILSIPFAAKWHYIPYDYWRFTPSGIQKILDAVPNISLEHLYRRGGDVTVAFHMMTVVLVGLLFQSNVFFKLIGLLLSPLAFLCGVIANCAEIFDWGAPENTLGYIFTVKKN